jgi:hypothetical protein
MFSMQGILLILALAFIIPSPAKGTVENAIGTEHVLHFSAGWRTNESSPQNVLQLGIVFPCGIGWCVEYEEFPGKANLPRTRLPYRHAMVAPYGTHQCTDEHVTTIHGVIHSDVPAQLIDSEGGFILQADSFEYRREDLFSLKQAGQVAMRLLRSPSGLPISLSTRRGD